MRISRSSSRGVTLLEMMTALAALTVVMGGAYMFFQGSERAAETRDAFANVEQAARNLVDKLATEIRQSSANCPDWEISPAGDSITFNKAIAYDGDDIVWSPAITYALVPTLGETADEVDDNGNNLVDESILTRTEADDAGVPAWVNYNPGPPTLQHPGLIEAGNLQFSLNERIVTITLTVSLWDSYVRILATGQQTAAVTLRNN